MVSTSSSRATFARRIDARQRFHNITTHKSPSLARGNLTRRFSRDFLGTWLIQAHGSCRTLLCVLVTLDHQDTLCRLPSSPYTPLGPTTSTWLQLKLISPGLGICCRDSRQDFAIASAAGLVWRVANPCGCSAGTRHCEPGSSSQDEWLRKSDQQLPGPTFVYQDFSPHGCGLLSIGRAHDVQRVLARTKEQYCVRQRI